MAKAPSIPRSSAVPEASVLRRYRSEFLISLFLATITFAIYGHVLQNELVDFDDLTYITSNPHVLTGLTGPNIRWAFTTNYAGNWHPLTWLSLQLDAQLFGPKPWAFHLTNLLLHCANSVLLFVVLRAMTGAVWRSAVVAALFAWHPLHVESVAWAAERKDVLSTFFWMLTLGVYFLYVRLPGWRRYLAYLAVCVCLALGLLAKPMLVTLPFVLLLLDFWPLGRLPPNKLQTPSSATAAWKLLRLFLEKVPLFTLVAASCLITWQAQQRGGAVQSLAQFPLSVRAANALVACVGYLGKMLFPVDLAAYYPHPRDSLTAGQVAGAGLLLLAVTIIAVGAVRHRPYLLVGWLWYLGTLVPVLGLVQVGDQAMADRYTYVPLIGIFVALTWACGDALARWRSAWLVLLPASAVLLVFCVLLTWLQVGFWHDSYSLWAHADEVTTDNVVAKYNLGVYFTRRDPEKAKEFYRDVVGIEWNNLDAHNALGMLLLSQGKYAEALEHQTAVLEIKAAASAEAGRWQEAIELQRRALENATAAKRPESARKIEARLRRYEQHQPWRKGP
jgi:hypothetical protein